MKKEQKKQKKQNKELYVIIIIILLIALSQFNEAVYGASLPKLLGVFVTSKTFFENTLLSYFLGFAIGTICWGYLADIFERKRILICGLTIYICSNLLSISSNSLIFLVFFRFFQGVGCSIGSVLAQAIIRDLIPENKRYNMFNIINIVIAFVPAIGLVTGLSLMKFSKWQSIFILLALNGLCVLSLVYFYLPRKIDNNLKEFKDSPKAKFAVFISCFQQIKKDQNVLRIGFTIGGALGVLFTTFSQITLYVESNFQVSFSHSLIISLFMSIALFIGGLISKKMNRSPNQKIYIALKMLVIFSIIFLIIIRSELILNYYNKNLFMYLCLVIIYAILATVSIIMPNCLSQMLTNYKKYPGTAASIFGFYYYIITLVFVCGMKFLFIYKQLSLPIFYFISALVLLLNFRTIIKLNVN